MEASGMRLRKPRNRLHVPSHSSYSPSKLRRASSSASFGSQPASMSRWTNSSNSSSYFMLILPIARPNPLGEPTPVHRIFQIGIGKKQSPRLKFVHQRDRKSERCTKHQQHHNDKKLNGDIELRHFLLASTASKITVLARKFGSSGSVSSRFT